MDIIVVLFIQERGIMYTNEIRQRTSIRSYQNDEPTLQFTKLKEVIKNLNTSEYYFELYEDSQAFGSFMKTYGLFTNVNYYIICSSKNSDSAKESLGYYGEQLVLEATSLGLGTCWVGGTFDTHSHRLNLPPQHILQCVITIGLPEEKLKDKLIKSLLHRKKKSLEVLGLQKDSPLWFSEGIHAVSYAPSAINKQPYKFTLEGTNVRVHDTANASFQAIDRGIAMYHFTCGSKKDRTIFIK